MKHRNSKKLKLRKTKTKTHNKRKFRGSKKSMSYKSMNYKRMTNKKKYGGVTNPFTSPSPYAFANKVDCSNMNVDVIKDIKELHTRYQKCCPKTMLGYKNTSPICQKMEQNFNNLWAAENNSHGHYGYEHTPTSTL